MNKRKRIILIVIGLIIGSVTISLIVTTVSRKSVEAEWHRKIETCKNAISTKEFGLADSLQHLIYNDSYKYLGGDDTVKLIKQNIKRARFRAKVDILSQLTDEGKIKKASKTYPELLIESVSDKNILDKDKEYLKEVNLGIARKKRELMKPFIKEAQLAIEKMHVKTDKFEKVTWYTDNTSPRFTDANGFFLYFGLFSKHGFESVKNLRLRSQYYGDSWLFHKSFKLLIDKETFYFKPEKVNRDSGNGGYAWEWSDQELDSYSISYDMEKVLVELIKSNHAFIRFEGKRRSEDKKITSEEKRALKNILLAFIAKGGYFKYASELF